MASKKKTLTTVDDLPAGELQDLADISLHRVWWRRHWVLWFGEPFEFEKRRPWSHHQASQVLVLVLAIITAGAWTATVLIGSIGWGIAAAAVTLVLAFLLALVVIAELKFWAWWTKNDDRAPLDAFRRPERLHREVYDSRPGLRALSKVGDPAELVTDFALEHSRRFLGIRSYGTPGWVRLVDIAEINPLIQLHSTLTQWRAINESWTDESEWDAEFTGKNPRPRQGIIDRLRGLDPFEAAAVQITDAARDVRASLELAADRGLQRIYKLGDSAPVGRTVLPAAASVVAALAVVGAITWAGLTLSQSWSTQAEQPPTSTQQPTQPTHAASPTPEASPAPATAPPSPAETPIAIPGISDVVDSVTRGLGGIAIQFLLYIFGFFVLMIVGRIIIGLLR